MFGTNGRGRDGGGGRDGGRIRGRDTEFVTRDELRTEMRRLQANIQAMFDQVRRNEGNTTLENEAPIAPTTRPILRSCDYKTFLSCKPPTFLGERDPVKAMEWLKEIEAIFKVVKCADGDKVLYGTTMLKSDALYWWETHRTSKESDVHSTFDWDEFTSAFKERFCSQAAVKDLEEEFMSLHQQGLSVRDYTASFLEKSRFAGYFVATEKLKVERYVFGLRSELRRLVKAREPNTFSEAVIVAENMERDGSRNVGHAGTGKRKMEESAYESEEDDFREFDNPQEYDSYEMPCSKCHSVHQGDCYDNSKKCYKCWKIGHIARNCRVTRNCYYCNSSGHLQYECPHWVAQQGSERTGSRDIETERMQGLEMSKGKEGST